MNYWYFFGWSEKKFKAYLWDKFEHDTILTNCDGKCIMLEKEGCTIILLWSRNKKDLPEIVHECVHAACWTLEERGWKPDLNNDEPLTYLVENIFEQGTRKISDAS